MERGEKKMEKEFTLKIYNDKGELEYDYPENCYQEIQKYLEN